MAWLWLRRIFATRWWRVLGAAAGVGLAAALLGTLGAFLSASFATMTDRAVAGVPVDWQVQVAPGADLGAVRKAVAAGVRSVREERVTYADVAGFSNASGGSVQTTGAGQVVGIDASYPRTFPNEFRPLVGSTDGVLLAQQTASNLHAHIGDRIEVLFVGTGTPPTGASPAQRRASALVTGIVDLPFADSFFQAVGAARAQAPQAPPDNVLIVPARLFQRWFSGQARVRPLSVRTQSHVRLAHDLPHDPLAALTAVVGAANSVELKSAGAAVIADNLAAQLQGTREDALYARLLFLFLGLPGAALAMIVALVVIASGRERWRHDAALLRIRGATGADIGMLAAVEAAVVWIVAVVIALAVTALAGRIVTAGAGAGTSAAWIWVCAGLAVAALIVAAGHFAPFLTNKTAAADLKAIGRQGIPLWRRMYLDLIVLAAGIVFFVNTAASGFQVVLAPEGVLQSSVSYDAFAGPFLLWLGGGLFVRRLAEMWLSNRALLVAVYRGIAGNLAGIVAAALSRQNVVIGRGLTIVALAVAFAVSIALFNETYNAQARIDAELTNGADVAIALPNAAGDSSIRGLALIAGVSGTDVLQHRFAYVGQDLQDLYAIDPSTIGKATDMSNAFFGNHDARATLSRLASQPDGALLAEETIADFQLHDGDRINLRLQSGRDGKYRPVQFTFVGAVREFPTAPRDSFIVANAAYIDRATGTRGARVVLLRAGSRDPSAIAADARSVVSGIAGARVSDIVTAQRSAGSSLTAVDLHGLTGIELAFALLLLIGASGLSLGLGFAERRRNFVILAALGATPQQVGAFLWAEAGTIVLGGIAGGIVLGVAVAAVLVKVLTGVFDPPPEMLAVPWAYLGTLTVLAVAATVVVVMWSRSASTRGSID